MSKCQMLSKWYQDTGWQWGPEMETQYVRGTEELLGPVGGHRSPITGYGHLISCHGTFSPWDYSKLLEVIHGHGREQVVSLKSCDAFFSKDPFEHPFTWETRGLISELSLSSLPESRDNRGNNYGIFLPSVTLNKICLSETVKTTTTTKEILRKRICLKIPEPT